jgi:sulfur transfer complex TusBCD TusB component (DsrH family)
MDKLTKEEFCTRFIAPMIERQALEEAAEVILALKRPTLPENQAYKTNEDCIARGFNKACNDAAANIRALMRDSHARNGGV